MNRYVVALIATLLLPCLQSYAQNSWTQKNWNASASGRTYPVSFEINGIVYFGTGYNTSSNQVLTDFWAYDPMANTMTQKASFPGTARFGSVSFAINGAGYVGSGKGLGNVFYSDFYKYDPVANSWTQVATYPGNPVWLSVSFVIGSKAYVGTGGYGTASTTQGSAQATTEFYSYDPATNTWSAQGAVANFPEPIHASVAFSINGFGYVGTGANANASSRTSSFYRYSPGANLWTAIADLPTAGRSSAYACAANGMGYVGLGGNSVNLLDLWQFNPNTGSWSQMAAFPGSARHAGVAVAANNKGYFICGEDLAEIWEYAPAMTGIENITKEDFFEVFPNPVTDDVVIRFKSHEKGRLMLLNVLGQAVLQKDFEGREINLNLSDFPRGQYFVQTISVDGTSRTKHLTKMD